MCLLCEVVNTHYNAVMATFRGRHVGYEVDADSLQMPIGNRKWLQEANGFAALVVGLMA